MEFRLPEIGEGVTEAEVVRWLVKEGDHVRRFQPIVEVTTVKVNIEVPSPVEGRIAKILAREGEVVKVGQVIAVIEEVGAPAEVRVTERAEVPVQEVRREEVEVKPERPKREVLASPAVRRLARELGVPLEEVEGTGPGGRITEEDVRRYAESRAAKRLVEAPQATAVTEVEYEEVPIRGVRRVIADHLSKAVRSAAYVTIFDEADVTRLVEVRETLKEEAERMGFRLTYLPFVIRAIVKAVKEYPVMNTTIDEERMVIRYHRRVNVSVAVHTEEGLVVPVLHGADGLSLFEVARRLEDLVERARSRKLSLEEVRGGTIGITNYGAVEGLSGTPIPNYPETAILGTGRIVRAPRVVGDQVVPRYVMPLALTFDHRIVDGEPASRFLRVVIRYLERPELLLL